MSPHHLRLHRHDQPLVDDRVEHALGKSCGQLIIAERKVARDRRSFFWFFFGFFCLFCLFCLFMRCILSSICPVFTTGMSSTLEGMYYEIPNHNQILSSSGGSIQLYHVLKWCLRPNFESTDLTEVAEICCL